MAVRNAHPKDWDGARNAFLAAVQNDAALLWELFEPYRAQAVQRLMTIVDAERRREELDRVKLVHAGGHAATEHPLRAAPSTTHAAGGRESGGGQFARVDLQDPTPSARSRGPEAIAAVNVVAAKSLLDTFHANGIPIGDMTAGEALMWSKSHERDTRFVRLLTDGMPPTMKIRKARTGDEAQKLYALATEAANA